MKTISSIELSSNPRDYDQAFFEELVTKVMNAQSEKEVDNLFIVFCYLSNVIGMEKALSIKQQEAPTIDKETLIAILSNISNKKVYFRLNDTYELYGINSDVLEEMNREDMFSFEGILNTDKIAEVSSRFGYAEVKKIYDTHNELEKDIGNRINFEYYQIENGRRVLNSYLSNADIAQSSLDSNVWRMAYLLKTARYNTALKEPGFNLENLEEEDTLNGTKETLKTIKRKMNEIMAFVILLEILRRYSGLNSIGIAIDFFQPTPKNSSITFLLNEVDHVLTLMEGKKEFAKATKVLTSYQTFENKITVPSKTMNRFYKEFEELIFENEHQLTVPVKQTYERLLAYVQRR